MHIHSEDTCYLRVVYISFTVLVGVGFAVASLQFDQARALAS